MGFDRKNIGIWQFVGFGIVSLLGTILHFLYEWTDSNFAALFSGVNESTWEHMKLLFFPLFLYALAESLFIGKAFDNFWCVKLCGTLLGLITIPTVFYTLRGIFGSTPDWINITIFFLSTAVCFIYETKEFSKENAPCKYEKLAFSAMCLIALMFFVFTFKTPKIPLFKDPTDGSFGI